MVNKDRLIEEFLQLVQIDSPSSKEGSIAEILKKKLEELGFEAVIDNAGTKVGSETGNIIANLKGNRQGKRILLSAHMDTVSPGVGVKPIVDEVEGVIKSDGKTILGSDDKAGVAAILEGIRVIKENNIEHSDIDVVFSIWEEGGLVGSKQLDLSKLKSDCAFVLDNGGSPGEIVVKAPAQDKITVKIMGKSAHAGVAPEEGISAIMVASKAIANMNLLRIDEETTANIGIVKGGIATNIVMPELEVIAESRSLNHSKLEAQTQHMIDEFKKAAEEFGAEIEISTERLYNAFNIDEEDELVIMLKKIFANLGIEAYTAASGGGSDANVFNTYGIKTVNMGIGMKNIHTLEEYISIKDLLNSAKMVAEIIKEV